MSDYHAPDFAAISSALANTPMGFPQSDKGRFFNHTWWPAHYKEVESSVIDVLKRVNDPEFDRRVNVLLIAQRVDAKNGNQLASMGFTPSETTRYIERAMNKRLKQITSSDKGCWVIRNQKLVTLALEHKPEPEPAE